MKKQAICVQCHDKPEQLNYLIEHMPESLFDFIIHVDSKSTIRNDIVTKNNVLFVKSLNVQWGRFSQVEATLRMFKVLKLENYSYIHLISGNDFIIKSPQYFIEFFRENDKEYIQSDLLGEGCSWSWGGLDRYEVFYPQWLIKRPSHKFMRLIRLLYREFVMRSVIFKRKALPVQFFYGGSQWFSITSACCCWMLKYLEQNKEYMTFFRHGVCSDEVFFSTLVRYSPFSEKIENNSLRFMLWHGTVSGGPLELKRNNILQMIESDDVFARKFTDMDTIKEVYKQLCK